MINIQNKADCSGCHACVNACPKNSITMVEDKEGFLYPKINKQTCIECGGCEQMCQSIHPINSVRNPLAYACWNKDEKIRMNSSSGGTFYLLAKYIIENNGVVFGAAFDENLMVHHIAVDSLENIYLLQGSKYVQSPIGSTYKQVKELLEANRLVLFTGTPCQIDGLLHYLRKDYSNLYTQDIVCHGVPSPKAWSKYLKYQEKINKSKIDKNKFPIFRNKKDGWHQYSVSINFENNQQYFKFHKQDFYMQAFLNNLSLRPSCNSCHSKSKQRNSDITLADFWGVEEILPEMFDNKGTSLVLINSEKGKHLFNMINKELLYKEVDFEQAISHNSCAYQSTPVNEKRKHFFKHLNHKRFDRLVKKEVLPPLYKRLYLKIGRCLSIIKNS